MKKELLILFIFMSINVYAQKTIKGRVYNEKSQEPLSNVLINIRETNKIVLTQLDGSYEVSNILPGVYSMEFSCIGYKTVTKSVFVKNLETNFIETTMPESEIELSEIVVSAKRETSFNILSAVDFRLRPHNSSQELLRVVPGLFIAQHAGGGKAEQIFLRGFDVDHGTDVAITVDDMPVNMVSHAHGQGYADLHFVIPETVENITFSKGSYDAKNGDFNTAGAVKFQTKNYIPSNLVKLELGRYNTYRGLGIFNLLKELDSSKKHNAYIATEYLFTRGFLINPQDFKRFNILGKYTGQLNSSTGLSVSVSNFYSKWDASGQIPVRAVNEGIISRLGAIDPTEGGSTSRTNVNLTATTSLGSQKVLKNQIYFTNYHFSLFSNFTFFKEDTINGDQIHQFENRNIIGYNSSFSNNYSIGKIDAKSILGAGVRIDNIKEIGLTHTVARNFLNDMQRGRVNQGNMNAFIDQFFFITPRISINPGIRLDVFKFYYFDKLESKSAASPLVPIISPKFNVYYTIHRNIQLFTSLGQGFHSNDSRVILNHQMQNAVPKSNAADVGANLKIRKVLFVNTSLWFLDLENEFVYIGDEGTIEAAGRSRRMGIDLSGRLQISSSIFLDLDVNYAKARLRDLPEGENYIPLAPPITSVAGISYKNKNGFSGSLRYRYMSQRPAVEDNSIVTKELFIADAFLAYTLRNFTLSITAENIFNSNWREAQFATESRLKKESEPVTEIHYTPGTPLFIKSGIMYTF